MSGALTAGLLLAFTLAAAPPDARKAFIEEVRRAGAESIAVILAAQIQQESGWDCDAVSPAGAVGCAQFMPGTWRLVDHRVEPSCVGVPRTNPACSFRSQIWLMQDNLSNCRGWLRSEDRIECALRSYNGAPRTLRREQAYCEKLPGCNPGIARDVRGVCLDAGARAPRHCVENTLYAEKTFRWVARNFWAAEDLRR